MSDVVSDDAPKGLSIAGFVLGILSFIVPVIGIALGIVGIVLSAMALKGRAGYRVLAIIGLVLSIVSVGSVILILLLFGGVVFAFLGWTGGF